MTSSRVSFRPMAEAIDFIERFSGEATDNRLNELLGSITLLTPGDPVPEEEKLANVSLVGAGEHQALNTKKSHSVLVGIAGAVTTKRSSYEKSALVAGIHFRQSEDSNNTTSLVYVGPNAKVLFRDCIFERRHNAVSAIDIALPAVPVITDCFVLVADGGRALFSGCIFRSELDHGVMNGTGTVVQSLSPVPGNVFVGDGVNLTTHTHGTTVSPNGQEI